MEAPKFRDLLVTTSVVALLAGMTSPARAQSNFSINASTAGNVTITGNHSGVTVASGCGQHRRQRRQHGHDRQG